MKFKFEIGDRVRGGPKLIRNKTMRDQQSRRKCVWTVQPWHSLTSDKYKIEGIYIGSRQYVDGYLEFDEDGTRFIPTNRVKVGLIVPHARANPVPVSYTTLEPLKSGLTWQEQAIHEALNIMRDDPDGACMVLKTALGKNATKSIKEMNHE